VLLADAMHWIELDLLSESLWVVVMGVASAFFFLTYLMNGLKKWGWLFPAFILAALAITAQMAISGADGSFLGAPILAAIALPFFVGWLLDRKSWGLLFPAFILTASALVTLFADSRGGAWVSGLVPVAVALPFFVAYLMDRKRRGLLIPGFILLTAGVIATLGSLVSGEWVGAVTMYAIALPFLVVYLLNRRRRWALIPAIVLAVIGTIPLISAVTSGDVTAVIIMFLFSAPFFIVYFWSKMNWWALIPAGVFATIGVVVLLTMLFGDRGDALEGLFRALIFLGFALTFGVLWLRRKSQPTGWAKWPALGLLGASALALILEERFQDFWPVIVLSVIGITLLVGAFSRKKAPVENPVPAETPAPVETQAPEDKP
jgi:hypothetical protein